MGVRIDVSHLTMTYGALVAVDDVSFVVEPGKFFGLLGPNGAGKTTALEAIEGLRRPAGGTVRLDGHDPNGATPPCNAGWACSCRRRRSSSG